MNFTNTKKDTLLANVARKYDVTIRWVWELIKRNRIASRADWFGVYVNIEEFCEYIKQHQIEYNKHRIQHKKRLRAK